MQLHLELNRQVAEVAGVDLELRVSLALNAFALLTRVRRDPIHSAAAALSLFSTHNRFHVKLGIVAEVVFGPLQMRLLKQLRRYLPKLLYLDLEALALRVLSDRLQIDGALIAQIKEQVVGPDGLLAPLLAAEYEVDPLVQTLAHVAALQRLAHLLYEQGRVVSGPARQNDIVDADIVLASAQVELQPILQEAAQLALEAIRVATGVIELGYQLLHVRVTLQTVFPGF